MEEFNVGVKALQEAKEESQSFEEELKQDQKNQSMREAMVYTSVASFLQKVVGSCLKIAENDILNQDCVQHVQGYHGVEIEGDQLRLKFPRIPASIQINQTGQNVEVHNEEMIVEDKQENEVILTLRSVAGRLAELNVAKKITNQEMGSLEVNSSTNEWIGTLLDFPAPEYGLLWDSFLMEDGTAINRDEGTSNAAANEANVELSCDLISIVRSYNDLKHNDKVLTEIMREHPDLIDNFFICCPHLQDYFMNLLAEIYKKFIKGNQKMLKIEEIRSTEIMVRDMERTGLQVTWLKKMLKKSRERLETQEANRKLAEMYSYKVDTKEPELEQAQLVKKARFQ